MVGHDRGTVHRGSVPLRVSRGAAGARLGAGAARGGRRAASHLARPEREWSTRANRESQAVRSERLLDARDVRIRRNSNGYVGIDGLRFCLPGAGIGWICGSPDSARMAGPRILGAGDPDQNLYYLSTFV